MSKFDFHHSITQKRNQEKKNVAYKNKIHTYGWKKFLENSSNFANIFSLNVNFENIIIGLHVLIISYILENFQEDRKSIV